MVCGKDPSMVAGVSNFMRRISDACSKGKHTDVMCDLEERIEILLKHRAVRFLALFKEEMLWFGFLLPRLRKKALFF